MRRRFCKLTESVHYSSFYSRWWGSWCLAGWPKRKPIFQQTCLPQHLTSRILGFQVSLYFNFWTPDEIILVTELKNCLILSSSSMKHKTQFTYCYEPSLLQTVRPCKEEFFNKSSLCWVYYISIVCSISKLFGKCQKTLVKSFINHTIQVADMKQSIVQF